MAKKQDTSLENTETKIKVNRVEPNEPSGPPELGPSASRKVPQLISSTKSAKVEPIASEDPEPLDETEETGPVDEAGEPAARKEPVVRAYGEPVGEREDEAQLNEYVESPGDPDGVVDAEERSRLPGRPVKARKRHPFLKTLLFLVLLVAATGGVYWYGSYKADKDHKATQLGNQSVQAPAKKTPSTPADTTKQYSSTNFSLSFSYPGTWKVTDTANKLSLVSPETQLTGVDGQTNATHVIFTVQHQQQGVTDFPGNGAVAELASSRLAYAKPSTTQRAQTYVSYLGYHKENGLDALFVTGDKGYQQNQVVPLSDITAADPLIAVNFVSCADSTCADGTTTTQTLLASKWQDAQASKDVIDIIKSIVLL